MNFDHVLLVGYGAPSKAEEVLPFLRGVNEGRGVPEEGLRAVAKHYEIIGGESPYNAQVLDFKERLEKELCQAGMEVPVFIAMKNWNPFLKEVLQQIAQKGLQRGLAIPLTPYRAASAGAGYGEGLKSACAALEMKGLSYQLIEGWWGQEFFIQAEADEVARVLETLAPSVRNEIPILFSFHSLPVHHDPDDPVSRYAEEVRAASAFVAKRLGHLKWSVAYQSRPVSARTVWLEPDVEKEISSLSARGETQVLVVPLGFLCDNVEILYDLDYAARGWVERSGMEYLRAKTVLHHPKIAALFSILIKESGKAKA